MLDWQVWLLPVLWVVVGGGALAGLIVPPILHTLQRRRERKGETPEARAARRRRNGLVALALVVAVLSYTGLHALAATHADRLTVSVRSSDPSSGDFTQSVIFSSTLTGAGPVAAVQAAINDTPTLPLGAGISCSLGSQPIYFYDVSFSWHGSVVETAQMDTSTGCMFWHWHTLGLPNLRTHLDDTQDTALCTLHHLTGIPLPESWDNPCM